MTFMDFMELVNRIDDMSFALGMLSCMLVNIVFSFINWMMKKGEEEDDTEEI